LVVVYSLFYISIKHVSPQESDVLSINKISSGEKNPNRKNKSLFFLNRFPVVILLLSDNRYRVMNELISLAG
jgi:hypothetical protein